MLQVFICLFALLQTVHSEQLKALIPAQWDKVYKNITRPNVFCNYQLEAKNGTVGRVVITRSQSHLDTPLLVVIRQPTDIFSFSLPVNIDNYLFITTARTINPFTEDQNITIEFSSVRPVAFTLEAKLLKDSFEIPFNQQVTIEAAVAQPVYYSGRIPPDTDTVSLHVDSNSSSCMTVSVQKAGGSVADLTNNVFSTGMYQTMTKSATITVNREQYPEFYIVFVLKPNDVECTTIQQLLPPIGPPKAVKPTHKQFSVTLINKMNEAQYLVPVLLMLLILLVVFIMSIYYIRYELFYDHSNIERYSELRDDMRIASAQHIMDPNDDSSLSGSYDCLPDAGDKEVVRAKSKLTVADLSLRSYVERNDKYKNYVYYLCILSLFYMLPTVQLVLSAVDNIHSYGNLDLCWYNFRCARPLWKFFAINNIIRYPLLLLTVWFSNGAYVFLGFLLIIMTFERNKLYKESVEKEEALETSLGLPQHPSLMYAIGIAIIMEGLLSGSYHICPNATNYQFDTSFMYVIALLGMLKIYQLRHPDIIANAHVAYGVIGGFIFIAMLGVRWYGLVVWIIFPILYVIVMFFASIEFYFKGVWNINLSEIRNNLRYSWASSKWCSCVLPKYKGRFFFLLLANAANILFLVYGLILRPTDFASYLLIPFLANLFLYLLYYIVMKFSHGEMLNCRALLFLAISTFCWASSMWFFFHMVSDWSKPPARSRELNQPCVVLNFFDNHDVWHFLSAVAMFISFILLDRIDDDIRFVDRRTIRVF